MTLYLLCMAINFLWNRFTFGELSTLGSFHSLLNSVINMMGHVILFIMGHHINNMAHDKNNDMAHHGNYRI